MIFKKYLVTPDLPIEIPSDVHQEEMTILENYLRDRNTDADRHKENKTICVRKRKNKGLTVYNYEKRYTVGGERI